MEPGRPAHQPAVSTPATEKGAALHGEPRADTCTVVCIFQVQGEPECLLISILPRGCPVEGLILSVGVPLLLSAPNLVSSAIST